MKVDDEISKSFETIIHLKTQIEEAKRVEELLKNQINEKEESCDKLEAEVVYLRKKVEKSNKFLNSSQILDEILESQRSPCDKSGLGYKEESTHAEASCWQPTHFFLSSIKLPTPMFCKHHFFFVAIFNKRHFHFCDICTFVFVKFSRL
jgi:hypothetical protein